MFHLWNKVLAEGDAVVSASLLLYQTLAGEAKFEEGVMSFTMAQLIEKRQGEQYALHKRYINPALARVQAIIGFDKSYTRGEGCYLWDGDGLAA